MTSSEAFVERSVIPEERRAAVARALRETFGCGEWTDLRRMTRGLSSDLVYRVVISGTPYLLRIMTRIDESMDPARIYACMCSAAGAGLTPAVRYTSSQDGISITDFVEAVPLPADKAAVDLPITLRHLHALPRFPKEFNYVTAHKGFLWKFRSAGLLPKELTEQAFIGYDRVCAVYPRRESDMVSCHMDLKPENILFDGTHVWLVDWQAAFVNCRYFDLAVAGNFLLPEEDSDLPYLERYFGRTPNEQERARFFLMRQVVHMFYAAMFLSLGSRGRPVDQSADLPSFEDFHRRIWNGEIDLADNDVRIVYGRLHWERMLGAMREPEFEKALRIVADEQTSVGATRHLLPLP